MVTLTGWTWKHVATEVTLPQVQTLMVHWRSQPPLVVLAGRLCRYMGVDVSLPAQVVAADPQDAMKAAMAAGFPVANGRPDDPMLDFLDLPS